MPDSVPLHHPIMNAIRGLVGRMRVRKLALTFVDGSFYSSQSGQSMDDRQALDHYIKVGWKEGLDPSPRFSTRAYLARHADVVDTNPLLHYIGHGRSEGRAILGSGRLYDVTDALPSEQTVTLAMSHVDAGFYSNQSQRDFTQEAATRHYLAVGWQKGWDPSPLFSTRAYLEANPDVEREGENPLVHYLQSGLQEEKAALGSAFLFDADTVYPTLEEIEPALSYFDSDFYNRQINRPLSRDDGARHYIGSGWKMGFDPSAAFSTSAYLRTNRDVVEARMNPLLHYAIYGRLAGRSSHPSNKFLTASSSATLGADKDTAAIQELAARLDLGFYQSQVPEKPLTRLTAAEHYMTTGWMYGLSPSPDFVPADYLSLYPDIAANPDLRPYLHYISVGMHEGRLPRHGAPRIWSNDPRQVLTSIKQKVVNGFAEWLDYHYVAENGRHSLESREPDLQALDFTTSFTGQDLQAALKALDLSACVSGDETQVDVSIVIPTVNEQQVLLECLASIGKAATDDLAVEIIIVDNGSTDSLYGDLANHPRIAYKRFDDNVGFGMACNAGAEMARGTYLFFLNNDAQIAPGCVEQLIATHREHKAGLVGPKILSFDGRLQEAGCLLNADGTGALIGYGHSPGVPRFNYVRKVDHVSGAAILLTRQLFLEMGGFDSIYAPAYCEDADLSLKIRAQGHGVVYEPRAVVAHHLSKTSDAQGDKARSKRQRISKNRQTLVSRWSAALCDHQLRTIAFYLPQYHPIPENDLWWGKGFTEWTNLSRAEPNYQGHLQPRHPADLGFYDLRLPQVMEQQAELARRYGLSGFCYYYYNFDGKRLLETPLEAMLKSGRPDFPFCLCWANENWTKRWDGHGKDVLMPQSYSEESTTVIARDLMRYLRSKNYITVNGKPLVLIYRVSDLPHPQQIISTWRKIAHSEGIGDIMIASVESFELSSGPKDMTAFGCDITVEFPPHDMVQSPPLNVDRTNPDWTGSAHDYRELALNYMTRVDPGFKRIRSVLVGWDNTPRYRERSLVLEKAGPGAFQAWLEWTLCRTLEQNNGEERLVFINAWNEWCEGAYLEPDAHFGHAHLQALKNALASVSLGGANFAA